MANNYNGYLIKFGNTILPNNLLVSFFSVPNQRLETSAERDSLGELQRDTLPNFKTSITLTTHILGLNEKIQLQNIINSAMTNYVQRKCFITYWNDETNSYKTGYFYIPDITYTVIDADANEIQYSPIEIELIEY